MMRHMGSLVVTDHVWSEIGAVLGGAGPRRVAVAFLGADAPSLMPSLSKGDVLVCNAGDRALKSGATNPYAIEAFLDRGVAVFSRSDLHAKVYAARRAALVGSANASITAAGQREAGVRLDDAASVKALRAYVEQLASAPGAIRVDATYLELAQKLFRPSPGASPPGGSGGRSTRPLFVAEVLDEDPPVSVGRVIERTRRSNRFEVGETAGTVESNWFPTGSWRRGDRALFVHATGGERSVEPPARCLLVEPVSSRSRLEVCWWEYPAPVQGAWDELVQYLLEHGHRLSVGRTIRSSDAQRLIAEWFGLNEAT